MTLDLPSIPCFSRLTRKARRGSRPAVNAPILQTCARYGVFFNTLIFQKKEHETLAGSALGKFLDLDAAFAYCFFRKLRRLKSRLRVKGVRPQNVFFCLAHA